MRPAPGEPHSRVPPENVLKGTTEAGSQYELRLIPHRWQRSRPGTIELVISRPGSDGSDGPDQVSGRPVRQRQLVVAMEIHCDEPRETFLFGQLKPNAARVEFTQRHSERTSGLVGPSRMGIRLYVLALRGVMTDGELAIFDADGEQLFRERFELSSDPSSGFGEETGGVSFGLLYPY